MSSEGDAADETSAAHNDERMTTKTTAISTGATDANPPAEGTHLLETTHRPTIRCESRHFSHDIIIIIMYTRVLSNWRKVCRDKFFQRNSSMRNLSLFLELELPERF